MVSLVSEFLGFLVVVVVVVAQQPIKIERLNGASPLTRLYSVIN